MTKEQNLTKRGQLSRRLSNPAEVRWEQSGIIPYPDAVARMEHEVAEIAAGDASELVWLLEHPPIYTAGTSAKPADLVDPDRFPVYVAARGGQYTYHGPGQRVAYVMLNLARRGGDVRAFVAGLEEWLIRTLGHFGIEGERRDDRIGVWVRSGNTEKKIAALGIRVRRGITFHGVSLNVDPDLSHFAGIIPCGVQDFGVTSLRDLGVSSSMAEVDQILHQQFSQIFEV